MDTKKTSAVHQFTFLGKHLFLVSFAHAAHLKKYKIDLQ